MRYSLLFLFFLSYLHAGTINIVAIPDCPYYCSDKEKNRGFIIDMIEHVYKQKGYDVSYTSLDSRKDALASIREGKYDLLLGNHLKENSDLIFMKKPLGYKYNIIAVPTYSKWKYTSNLSLKKLRLAAIKEVAYEPRISKYISKYKYDKSKLELESGHLARKHNLKKLRFDKIDALIDDRVSLQYFYFKKKKPFLFKIAYTAISQPIEPAFASTSYRAEKYANLLYQGLKRVKGSKKLSEILGKYGLSEAYIRELKSPH